MLGIGSFFERFRSRELDEILFRAAVVDVIKEVVRFELDPRAISYANNIVSLNVSSAAKSAVMVKKTEILEKIKGKIKRNVVDIR